MKNIILLFFLLIPAFLFAQYPNTGNKARLGYQTTGDGLIWRGVAADTVLKPRVIAHAYFQLDTVNGVLRRYIATRGSWQDVSSETDSTVYATRYWTSANFFPLQGGTLTGTGGAGFVGFPSQVTAPGTPASGLNVYAQGSSFNWKGTDGYERQFGSTLTGGRTYTLPDVSGTFALGTGTADRLARWTATNTLAAGNLSDNATRLQALLPWQFHSWTDAGRPTGVTGYTGYNTTGNGIEWYQGSRWAYGLESTFARGTANRVPVFNANGQVTDYSGFTYTTGGGLGVSGSSTQDYALYLTNTGTKAWAMSVAGVSNGSSGSGNLYFIQTTNSFSALGLDGVAKKVIVNGDANLAFSTGGQFTLSTQDVGISRQATNTLQINNGTKGTTATGGLIIPVGTTAQNPGNLRGLIRFNTTGFGFTGNDGASEFYWMETNLTGGKGTVSGSVFFAGSNRRVSEDPSIFFWDDTNNRLHLGGNSPQRTLHITGEARITDLTTDTPTRIVGADTDGDLGAITVGTGLSLTSGTLSATAAADGNGIYSGSATLSNHTTRARVPDDGNLLFSQTYNGGADSTYWQVVNYGGGERALNFGLTDTSSTGYARVSFYSDGTGVMNWGFETSDAVFGNTTVRAFEGDLDFSVNTGSISLTAPVDSEVRLTGMVRAKQEGYYEINSTSSPQDLSNVYSDNLIDQGGTQATFTLVFPASPEDGQILKITYNNNISSLTLDGNGNTIVGTTVTTAVEGSQRVFKFYAGAGVWIRQN